MFFIGTATWGVLIILYGLILLTRKKFMIRRECDGIFIFFFTMLNPAIQIIEMGYGIKYLIILILSVSALVIFIARGRYTLTNVNAEMVLSALTDILNEKNISYGEENNTVILKDYDSRRITYTQSLSSVEVSLKNIRNLSIYEEVKTELKSRIKQIDLTVFPSSGLFYIVLGAILMVGMQYFQKKLLN
ncbi:hypothetical protein [Clostridium formicaceticum]|uniref:Uncharacterized protein n=1 Tax=Clostridium formicaceticum TaxID=1497 RepID=A0AAC9RJJ7_9CLOT|nr:hypothetical protein [Clostridium formicaceticum]AOY76798.1 hypothetical protein BJL90_13615 [Clostridium formicaceticum]ARE87266.1 hypothetical protein CLFO_16650 [Clostridium formicaceticum]